VAWGNNRSGQTTIPLAAQSGVTAIAAGGLCGFRACDAYTVALKNDGTVVAWGGYNASPYSATANPVTLGGQVLSGVTAIAAGYGHTVALKNDSSVVAWGTGEGTNVPVAAQSGVTAIAAGGVFGSYTVALKNDGTVVAWGDNYYGQVTGTLTTDYPYSATASPVTLGGQVLSGTTAIAAGSGHTVALIGGVPLLPVLHARPSGNDLILSWSTSATGFTLQSTLDLTPPAPWIDVTNVPALPGAQWTVTNIFSGSAQFYRLRKP